MKHISSILTILLLVIGQAQAQNDAIFETAAQRLYSWHSLAPTEKLYVHQDRTRYVAGETIWFKVYQSFSGNIDESSGVVYVDLIDGSNTFVAQTKWKLEDGMAAGHIDLPAKLPAGNYQLRACTRWMQNFDSEGFFTREISVLSPYPSKEEADFVQENRLALFPEGGNLVAGLFSRIAFEATDANGKGIDAKGSVIDSEGNLVQEFETRHAGMGFFNFKPEVGKEYIAKLAGTDVTVCFPEALKQGIVMEARYLQDLLRITFRHNMDSRKTFYLTVHQNENTFYHARVNINGETVFADIPAENLPAGIFTVTIYDETYHAWCERLCLINYPEQLHLTTTTVDKDAIGRREKVTLTIEAKDMEGNPHAGNFSLSVVKVGIDDPQTRDNFYTDYFLKSELRGRIDNPSFYTDEANRNELNLLLMTHGWRRYA